MKNVHKLCIAAVQSAAIKKMRFDASFSFLGFLELRPVCRSHAVEEWTARIQASDARQVATLRIRVQIIICVLVLSKHPPVYQDRCLTCKVAHIASRLGAQAAAQHVDAVIRAKLLRHQPLEELRCLVPNSFGVLDSCVVPCGGGWKTHMGKNLFSLHFYRCLDNM